MGDGFFSMSVAATMMPHGELRKDAKGAKGATIMTPIKGAKQDQWWGSSPSEYVVDTTITNDANRRISEASVLVLSSGQCVCVNTL